MYNKKGIKLLTWFHLSYCLSPKYVEMIKYFTKSKDSIKIQLRSSMLCLRTPPIYFTFTATTFKLCTYAIKYIIDPCSQSLDVNAPNQ